MKGDTIPPWPKKSADAGMFKDHGRTGDYPHASLQKQHRKAHPPGGGKSVAAKPHGAKSS